jgi:hypothetical protein
VDGVTSYAPKWRDLRRRNLLFSLAYLAVPVGGIGAYNFLPRTDLGNTAVFIIFVTLFLMATGVGAYRMSFLCPRCGNPFFEKGFWQNILARKCMHCGLPRGAQQGKAS